MKEKRRNAETGVQSERAGGDASIPGKRSLILESLPHFAAIALGPEMDPSADNAGSGIGTVGGGGGGNNAVGGGNGGDVENPLGQQQAVPTGAHATKTSVAFKETSAPPLVFHGNTYRDLYGAVSQHVGKEAGSVTRTPTLDTGAPDGDGNIPTAKITYELATMLPEWPEKGSQPAADQAKFNAWRASVSDHEKGHRDLYKKDLAKVTSQVVGPKSDDIDTQESAVEATAETNQDAYDAAGQPAPLAAPGGIEKIGADGSRSPTSENDTGGDTGNAVATAGADQAAGGTGNAMA